MISITYDKEDDLTAVTCFETDKNGNIKLNVAYVGETAEELIKIVTQQGYLKELLERIK